MPLLQSLTCRVLITADKRNVDADVFEAIHHSGLVYDGRLVVDRRFQVNRLPPSALLLVLRLPGSAQACIYIGGSTDDWMYVHTDVEVCIFTDL